MRRAFLAFALALYTARLALRLTALDSHASIVAGMPVDASSSFWGPCTIIVHLACILVAPVLLTALVLDALTRLAKPLRRARRLAPES